MKLDLSSVSPLTAEKPGAWRRGSERTSNGLPLKRRTSSPVATSQSLSSPAFSTFEPPPERKDRPVGENATEFTGVFCPSKLSNVWPVAASQSLNSPVLSPSTLAPERMTCPSGEKATELTEPGVKLVLSDPVSTSQNLSVPSPDPETAICPFGEKATAFTV